MINAQRVEAMLRDRYHDLENVGRGVFRGVDRFGSRDYAVRYFDLNDQLAATAPSFKRYQEEVLSQTYFSSQVATDLRWSHYLYFVTSDEEANRSGFGPLKAKVESDREYARKQVILEDDVPRLLSLAGPPQAGSAMPVDLATTWSLTLEKNGLGFILDDDISVPDAVRRIIAGTKDKAARPVSPMALLPAEKAATSHFLTHLTIKGFRPHPEKKSHSLGRVNLVVGSNGVGKTSLLEAIEFGYCGRNRRSSPLSPLTSMILDLAGTTEKLTSTTDLARLRARHSNWYAKTELKKVSIQDSFGKFNFLDTDAAVNLSVSGQLDEIGADVTRLLLGAAAENLTDRRRRVLEQLQDELKNFRRDNSTNKQLKLAAQARLDVIKTAPTLSDSLFLELLAALKSLGWRVAPENKGHISTLGESLREAASSTELLRSSSVDILHSDTDSVREILNSLNEEAAKATALDQRAKSARLALSRAQREAQAAIERIAASEALLPYARADFPRLLKDAADRQDGIRARSAGLTLVPNTIPTADLEPLLGQRIAEAISSIQTQTAEYQRRHAMARSSLDALEKTQNSLTILRQRLLTSAQDLLQRVPNPDHCPLCRTEFESGQLLARMMADVDGNTAEQAGIFQTEIDSTSEALESAQETLQTLQSIDTFLGESSQTVTVSEALKKIDQERTQLDLDQSSLEIVQTQIQQLRAEGLSSSGLSKGLLAAGLAELPSLDALQVMQMNHKEDLEKSQNAAKNAQQELLDVQDLCEALATRLSIDAEDGAEALMKTIKQFVSDVEVSSVARQTLVSLLTIDSVKTATEIAIDISTAQQLVAKVATAIAQEGANNLALDKETKTVADLVVKIETSSTKIKRLADAEVVLETLIQQSSSSELTNQILNENVEEIARTFASIHMPNEFDLKTENGVLSIVRRQSGAAVQLDQMSTGQRAAFALSLFLAMNGRLNSGPPILLFDDPVAHVDDINVLSFLDHLRHLAISGTRQIVFATADTKLAGLFRHKFRFLGDEFQEVVLTRG